MRPARLAVIAARSNLGIPREPVAKADRSLDCKAETPFGTTIRNAPGSLEVSAALADVTGKGERPAIWE